MNEETLSFEKDNSFNKKSNLSFFDELNKAGELQDSYNISLKEDVKNFVEEYFPDVNIEETKIFIPSEYGMDGDTNKLHVLVSFNSGDISDDSLFNELNYEVQPFEEFKIDWFPIDTFDFNSIDEFLEIKKSENGRNESNSLKVDYNSFNWYTELIQKEISNYYNGLPTSFSKDAIEKLNDLRSFEFSSLSQKEKNPYITQSKAKHENALYMKGVFGILDLENPWKNTYIFSYTKNNKNNVLQDGFGHEGYDLQGRFIEYDGTEINAPNKITACKLFISQDGTFGIPDIDDYEVYTKEEYEQVKNEKSQENKKDLKNHKNTEKTNNNRKRDGNTFSR